MDQGHPALVHLRRGFHHLKHPFRAGNGGQDVVDLLADLADGLADLAGILEIDHQRPQVQPKGDGQQRADAAGQGVVDVADVAHGGHHGAGEGLGVGGAAAVRLVARPEALPCLGFVVKDLDDLLPFDHFLDIAVDLSQVPLLGHEVPAGPLAHSHNDRQHQPQGEHRHQKQQRTEVQHHGNHADEGEPAGDQGDHAVLQNLGEGVDIVGVAAHELAVGVGVEVAQRQILHPGEEVPADGVGGLLGHADHDPGIAVAEQGRAEIDAGHKGQRPGQPGVVPGNDALVDEGPEHIGPADGAGGIQHQAHRYHRQQPF